MVDAGDNVSLTLRKEFAEEAMNSLEQDERDQQHINEKLDKVFRNGTEVVYLLFDKLEFYFVVNVMHAYFYDAFNDNFL